MTRPQIIIVLVNFRLYDLRGVGSLMDMPGYKLAALETADPVKVTEQKDHKMRRGHPA